MSPQLVELPPQARDRSDIDELFDRVATALWRSAAELIEAPVPPGLERVFLVAEVSCGDAVGEALIAVGADIAEVRPAGAELTDVKNLADGRPARYLVKWDLPHGLSMDGYLACKQEKNARYARDPEVTFLRTYVRVDLDKCLCLYDAPDKRAVKWARAAVDSPIDRMHDIVPVG
jgi:hypothetical protein